MFRRFRFAFVCRSTCGQYHEHRPSSRIDSDEINIRVFSCAWKISDSGAGRSSQQPKLREGYCQLFNASIRTLLLICAMNPVPFHCSAIDFFLHLKCAISIPNSTRRCRHPSKDDERDYWAFYRCANRAYIYSMRRWIANIDFFQMRARDPKPICIHLPVAF